MAEAVTLSLRADISDLQRKLREIPEGADGAAKKMAVSLERTFKRLESATTAAAKASAAAQSRVVAETERATQKLQDYVAAGDPVAELTLKFQREAAEIERLAKVTGDAKSAQIALTKASSNYADELAALRGPVENSFNAIKGGADKAAGSNWKLNQQTLSLRKNVGDLANSLLAGQSPFTVLSQQGPQILEIFADADSATQLLQSSFGGLASKAMALAGPIAIVATAVAAAAAAYSLAANAADENADGNNRLAASFRKLAEDTTISSDALNRQREALRQLKEDTDTRREDLLVEIGAMDEYELQAKRNKDALAAETREKMLAITAIKAKLQAELETADQAWRSSKATSEQRKQSAQMIDTLRAQIKVEDEKIEAAKANYDQQVDDIDSTRLALQERRRQAEADKAAAGAKRGLAKETKAEAKEARDLAAAYEAVQGVVDGVVAANATAEHKLGMAAAERIQTLNEIAEKYADQPDLVRRAADAEFAVRDQLRADLEALRQKEAADLESAKRTLHERDLARAKELADQESRLQAQRMANVQSLSTFSSGVSDLLAQRSEANAKRDRALALRQFKASKAAAIAEATINGAVAITRALASLGPVAGALATAGISASTAAQIGVIASQKPAFDRGGMIQGGRMADQVPINALPGEAVLSRGAVRAIGGQAGVDRLNRGEASTAPSVVVLPVYQHFGRFVRDELGRSSVLQRATLRGRPIGSVGF